MPNARLSNTRTERDALGSLLLPFNALYGVQTERAVNNFRVSGITLSQFPELVKALAETKKAAARTNARLGLLPPEKAEIIERVCDEITTGQHLDHFPVDVFQGGAGTSSNMNINEVIANRGLELMNRPCGDYERLHPNDDVNRSQSTNDVYPTAVRIAVARQIQTLCEALLRLSDGFVAKGVEFEHIVKLGRTELQDAVPMTLGAEFRAFGTTIREDVDRLSSTLSLLSEVNLGGTAVGTGVTAPADYRAQVVPELALITGLELRGAYDLVEASWDTGVFVHVSGVMKRVATKLSKIANDLRLLSSGPRGGLGEIKLMPMQPGSSLMPGKVNPVIPEMVNQVAFHVIGSDLAVTFAAEGGQLQLNPFEPLIAFSLLQSLALLSNAADIFRSRCVELIEADEERCLANLEASTANFTELVPLVGYEEASRLAKEMLKTGKLWKDTLPEVNQSIAAKAV
ncbi:aspartate ammonia-lyase [Microvirga sp. BT689]|uniref:aspartate ammonia-lyase n=1 Tax=Microvirga arvi TaxID=2778731 RepID=UPI00194DB246|nr:aspartate ammonia-lyase [Microvirga arvi]MBM6584185.1 aspartate ammonia-lyase [Microvirga arvi]